MDLTLVTSYDASPEEVFAMITDVTFQEQVFERLRARSYDVVVGDSGDDRAVRVHWQTQPVDVPAVARRLVGHSLVLAQNKIWHRPDVDGAREAGRGVGVGGRGDIPLPADGGAGWRGARPADAPRPPPGRFPAPQHRRGGVSGGVSSPCGFGGWFLGGAPGPAPAPGRWGLRSFPRWRGRRRW